MKRYYIQSRVSTGIEILAKYTHDENEEDIKKMFKSEFEYEGLHFEQWDFSVAQGALGNAWLIKSEIGAENAPDAINLYLRKLSIVLPRIFFSVPVWHSFGFHQPLLISNDEFKSGFYFLRQERRGTGLVITPATLSIIKAQSFKNIPDKFFLYYSEFINANTALSGLSLGMGALEVIRPVGKNEQISIFGEDLRHKIYGTKPEGIRHKIHHGKYPDESDNIEADYKDMNLAIKKCLLVLNPDLERIFSLREQFVGIPRQKNLIEGFGGMYIYSNNEKRLDLREVFELNDTNAFEFHRKIKMSLSIEYDSSRKIINY